MLKCTLEVHFPYRLAVGLKPLDRLLQSIAQAMSVLEFKERLGSTDIKASARPGIYVLAMATNGF